VNPLTVYCCHFYTAWRIRCAKGDYIRFTFKSQKVTIGGNDYEITDATGAIFYSWIPGTVDLSESTIADAVWDETMAGHVTADTAGLVLNEWQDGGRLDLILDARMAEASINTTAGAVDSVTTVTGNVDGSVGSVTGAVGSVTGAVGSVTGHTNQTGDSFAIVNGAAGLVAIDTVVDSILALLDDARGEPGQGAPPVNPDMATKVDWLYKMMRNKIETTSTTISVYDDAGSTVDHKSTISDDGTTFTRGEFATGP